LSVREMTAPTLRSLLGHASKRLPTPGINELSTVEWHTAQVIPILDKLPSLAKVPFKPTTEFNLNNSMVDLGSSSFISPDFIFATTSAGSASASTFKPTARAVCGLTPAPNP